MNQVRLRLLHARVYYDLAATYSAPLVAAGVRLGFYRILAIGPMTSAEFACAAGIDFRYARAWLINQSAAGYIVFDARDETYSIDDEQREIFLGSGNEALAGSFLFAEDLIARARALEPQFRGAGPRGEIGDRSDLMDSLDPAKADNLLRWIPADVRDTLSRGGRVLELGCCRGAILMRMAAEFPRSVFVGVEASGAAATAAAQHDVRRMTMYRSLEEVDGSFDLIVSIDTLHEVGDAHGVAERLRPLLDPNGAWIIAEGRAGESVAENINVSGRMLSAVEMLHCLPSSRAFGEAGAGPLAGQRFFEEIARSAGFERVEQIEDQRRLVLEIRR